MRQINLLNKEDLDFCSVTANTDRQTQNNHEVRVIMQTTLQWIKPDPLETLKFLTHTHTNTRIASHTNEQTLSKPNR